MTSSKRYACIWLVLGGCAGEADDRALDEPASDETALALGAARNLACPAPHDVIANDPLVAHGADVFGYSQNVLRGARDCGGQRSSRSVLRVSGTGSCAVVSDGPRAWANELCANDPNLLFGNAQITQACQDFALGGPDLGDHDCRYIVHVGASPYVPAFDSPNDTMCQPSRVARVFTDCPPPPGASYSSVTGFSTSQGANQWSYLDGNGASMVYDTTYAGGAWHSPTPANGDWCYISKTQQHPGTNSTTLDSIRRWTAPTAGVVKVVGNSKMTGANGGDGALILLRKNGGLLDLGLVAPSDTTVGKSWSWFTTVAAGDTIDTVVNRGTTYNNDEQVITQTITYQSQAQTFSSTLGFGTTQGANQWTYLDGNGASMVYDTTYAGGAWHSVTPANGDWCYISKTQQHPGTNASTLDSVRRWTALYAGTVTIVGNSRMTGANLGDGALVMIRKNGVQLFGALVAASDTTVGRSWSLTASVLAGDTIDTVVNRGATYNGDEQLLSQTITYLP